MEAIVGGGGGGGGGGDGGSIDGSSSGGSVSTVSKEELAVEQRKSNTINNTGMSNFEVSSYPDDQDDELELGLGLSLGVGTSSSKNGGAVVGKQQQQQVPRILTAKDLPSCITLSMASSAARTINVNSSTSSPSSASSSSSATGGRVQNDNKGSIGTKRTADSVNSPTGVSSQVVGWPPVPAHRVNNLANQAKSSGTGEIITKIDQGQGKGVVYGAASKDIKGDAANRVETGGHFNGSLFVKVNMYGVGIGRKVDLSVHSSYKSLGRKLEEMFNIPTRTVGNLASGGEEHGTICSAVAPSELFDGSSEFVLTYEDKDGDWMLVGDVPWEMFLSSVKRLRIMKTSDARGLAPRCEERNAKQRTRHV